MIAAGGIIRERAPSGRRQGRVGKGLCGAQVGAGPLGGGIGQEQIEAATIDGAGTLRRLIDVVLPAIFPVAVVNVLLTTILTFNYFDIIYVLTRGGPLNATAIFPTRIYELGFGEFRFGLTRYSHYWTCSFARTSRPRAAEASSTRVTAPVWECSTVERS